MSLSLAGDVFRPGIDRRFMARTGLSRTDLYHPNALFSLSLLVILVDEMGSGVWRGGGVCRNSTVFRSLGKPSSASEPIAMLAMTSYSCQRGFTYEWILGDVSAQARGNNTGDPCTSIMYLPQPHSLLAWGAGWFLGGVSDPRALGVISASYLFLEAPRKLEAT